MWIWEGGMFNDISDVPTIDQDDDFLTREDEDYGRP